MKKSKGVVSWFAVLIFVWALIPSFVACGKKLDGFSEVDREAALIDQNLGKLKKVDKHLIPGTDNGGELEAWVDNSGDVKKIKMLVGFSAGMSTQEFYLKKGNLILMVSKSRDFEERKDGSLIPNYKDVEGPGFRYYCGKKKFLSVIGPDGKKLEKNDPMATGDDITFKIFKMLLECVRSNDLNCNISNVTHPNGYPGYESNE